MAGKQHELDQYSSKGKQLVTELKKIPDCDSQMMKEDMETVVDQWLDVSLLTAMMCWCDVSVRCFKLCWDNNGALWNTEISCFRFWLQRHCFLVGSIHFWVWFCNEICWQEEKYKILSALSFNNYLLKCLLTCSLLHILTTNVIKLWVPSQVQRTTLLSTPQYCPVSLSLQSQNQNNLNCQVQFVYMKYEMVLKQ